MKTTILRTDEQIANADLSMAGTIDPAASFRAARYSDRARWAPWRVLVAMARTNGGTFDRERAKSCRRTLRELCADGLVEHLIHAPDFAWQITAAGWVLLGKQERAAVEAAARRLARSA